MLKRIEQNQQNKTLYYVKSGVRIEITKDNIPSFIKGHVSKIRGNVSNISGDVSDISGDVSDISGDVSNICGHVSKIRGNVSDISGDVSNIWGNTSYISGDVNSAREEYFTRLNIEDDYRILPIEVLID